MSEAICGGSPFPDVAEPVIGRAFARPVGSSGLHRPTSSADGAEPGVGNRPREGATLPLPAIAAVLFGHRQTDLSNSVRCDRPDAATGNMCYDIDITRVLSKTETFSPPDLASFHVFSPICDHISRT